MEGVTDMDSVSALICCSGTLVNLERLMEMPILLIYEC